MTQLVTSLDEALAAIIKKTVKEALAEALKQKPEEDRLLDAEEAAKLLCVSEDWLYRHAKKLPFSRKLGPKLLRFSHLGITKYLASKC